MNKIQFYRNKSVCFICFLCFLFSAGYSQDFKALNTQIDQWHRDVAEYRLDDYFESMSEGFVFLGTAPGERWNKEQFLEFCQPYFEKKSTWDFKPSNRNWTIDEKRGYAWFDEDLDTWMEDCRGSGILRKEGEEWKIIYYNLTVLIENEKIQPFIELRKQ